jgi:hypothetical protein
MNGRNSEQVGKVFLALAKDLRQCLVCDGLFTREAGAKHAGATCFPKRQSSESTVHDVWSAFTGRKKLKD